MTFLELGRVEYAAGYIETGAKSLLHSREAMDGARKGAQRVESEKHRVVLEDGIAEVERALQEFEASAFTTVREWVSREPPGK